MKKITLLLAFFLAFVYQSHAQFPAPYCPVAFTTAVEPITLVNFAGINNTTPNTIGPASATILPLENFTALTGNVVTGSSYPITVKGNTGGNFTTVITVFVDWNKNNVFTDAGETYNAGNIVNSTGVDAIQLVYNLVVPSTALPGTTRMRVLKRFNVGATSCQTGSGYGQGEDYTLSVTIPTCPAPSAGIASGVTTSSANLSWTSGGSANAEVLVQVAGGAAPALPNDTGVNVSGTTYAATGLTANTAYEFYVRDECTLGTDFSTWAGPFLFNTTPLPGCATLVSPADAVTNYTITTTTDAATEATTFSVTLTWTAPTTGGPAASYDVYFGTVPATLPLLGNIATLTVDITGIDYNTTYYWRIISKNVSGVATGCSTFSFTTTASAGYCLLATYGVYPTTTYTPATCNGTTVNTITGVAFGSEFSNVNVISGQTYKFASSNATDFVTLSADDGVTATVFGVTPITWTSTITGPVRFYTHTNDQCGPSNVSRTRSVICGAILANESFSIDNLKVYPNPVSYILNLSDSKNITDVKIFNLLGQQVISKIVNNNQTQIDMSELTQGSYFVKVTSDQGLKTIKVIKK